MDQQYIQIIQDLTEKVNLLLSRDQKGTHQDQMMNVQSSDCADPHLRARAPVVELDNYPELIEEFPDIEDD
ncbi:hypothetical protein AYI68_g5168, partial [Smittium mucronatum]